MGFVLDDLGTNGADCNRKVVSRRRVASATRILVNAKDLQLEYAKVLYKILLVPVLIYGTETIMEREGKI